MKYIAILLLGLLVSGCVSTPYASISAGKTVKVGGIDVGIGVGNILHP